MIQVINKYGAVKAPAPAPSSAIWGTITGTVTAQTDLTSYLSSNFYPLLSNPAGYITSSSLTGYVPYTGATANVDLGTFTLTTPTINGVSGLLRFGSTDKVSVGNYATPSAQRIFTVGQDTAFMSFGSMIGATGNAAIYMNTATPSVSNYTVRCDSNNLWLNSPSPSGSVFFANGDATMLRAFGTLSGSSSSNFNWTKSNSTNAAATTNIPGWNYVGGTRQWATGAITTQSEIVWGATTYSFVGASTIDTAYGNVFNAPIAGTNATITNNYAANFTGNIFLSGGNRTIKSSNGLTLEGASGGPTTLRAGNAGSVCLGILGETNGLVYSGYFSSGAITNFNFNKSSSVNQTASTAIVGWNYNGNSRTWLTGDITTQNENVWGAVTYNFGSASIITNAYGNVFNAPIAGANATITNNWAAQFNGKVQINGNITSTGAIDNQYYLNIVNPNLVATAAARIQVNNGAAFSSVFSIGSNGDAVDPSILYLGGSNKGILFTSNSVGILKVFDATRNITIQNGGTFTDAGYRLDVNGTGRFQNTLTLATGTTSIAPLNIPTGVAPTTPVNGDIWYNGTDLKIKSNGSTKDLTTSTTLDNLVFSGSYMPAKLAQSAMLTTTGLSGGISAIKISGRKTCTITSLSTLIATGVVGGLVRLGLYSSLNGRPNLLLADTGDLAATSAGLKEGAITPVTLQSGVDYFVCYQSTPGATAPSVYYNAYSELNIFNTANNTYYPLLYNTMTYGAYPATYPVGGVYTSGLSVVLYLKAQ